MKLLVIALCIGWILFSHFVLRPSLRMRSEQRMAERRAFWEEEGQRLPQRGHRRRRTLSPLSGESVRLQYAPLHVRDGVVYDDQGNKVSPSVMREHGFGED